MDGVIAVDPPGLAAMLKLTGPVTVPRWPVPITADNVVDVTLRQAYEQFPQDERVVFLGDLARKVTEAFTRADLGRPAQVTAALGPAASHGSRARVDGPPRGAGPHGRARHRRWR